MDLGCLAGCAPFVTVTLPLILPAIAAGWMLAFTLSLDDVVIASFHHRPRRGDAADPDLFGGAARREAGDQRDLHADDRLRRAGDRAASLASKLSRSQAESAAPL